MQKITHYIATNPRVPHPYLSSDFRLRPRFVSGRWRVEQRQRRLERKQRCWKYRDRRESRIIFALLGYEFNSTEWYDGYVEWECRSIRWPGSPCR
jgi:hypothetical protein